MIIGKNGKMTMCFSFLRAYARFGLFSNKQIDRPCLSKVEQVGVGRPRHTTDLGD